jgi:hypothetical protein
MRQCDNLKDDRATGDSAIVFPICTPLGPEGTQASRFNGGGLLAEVNEELPLHHGHAHLMTV